MFTRWWPMVSLCLLVLLVPCSGVVVHFSVPIGRSRDPRATALIRELLQEPPASLPSLMGRNLELLLNAEFMATLDDQIGSSIGAARTVLEDAANNATPKLMASRTRHRSTQFLKHEGQHRWWQTTDDRLDDVISMVRLKGCPHAAFELPCEIATYRQRGSR